MTIKSEFVDLPQDESRRGFLVKGAIATAAACLPYGRILAAGPEGEYLEADTIYGRVRGRSADGLCTFRGIPYAGLVSGPNRFKAAPPLQSWTGVRDALEYGPPAIQPKQPRFGEHEPLPSEDCLFLNVWTPAADGRKRPVMFYSHGGGFTVGSAAATYQDGGKLAKAWDVVVVATNHRLGLMGFLYLGALGGDEYATSGNQGMLDICDGLKWVHDNIASFGGDPANVMIFGESGGGAKTSCLYAMPTAEHYFNKASIESGPGIRMYPRSSAAETTEMVLHELGISRDDWRKLLQVPADKLLDVQLQLGKLPAAGPLASGGGRYGMAGNAKPGGFGPVVDGKIVPANPFDPVAPAISKNKPLIVGTNRDETAFFILERKDIDAFKLTEEGLKDRVSKEFGDKADALLTTFRKSQPDASPSDLYVAITTMRMFRFGSIELAERKYEQHGAPVYMYLFTHSTDYVVPGTQHKMGAAHASEIVYKFDNVQASAASSTNSAMPAGARMMPPPTVADEKAARNMSQMWATFARTGHPSASGQPSWPPYDTKTRATMEIDTQCTVVDDPDGAERKIWDALF
jgi:para-nitrobenzyl esterase